MTNKKPENSLELFEHIIDEFSDKIGYAEASTRWTPIPKQKDKQIRYTVYLKKGFCNPVNDELTLHMIASYSMNTIGWVLQNRVKSCNCKRYCQVPDEPLGKLEIPFVAPVE